MIGYIGAVMVAVSYMLPFRRLLMLQAVASVVLAVYSTEIKSWPYLSLQVFCLVLIVVKLWRSGAAVGTT